MRGNPRDRAYRRNGARSGRLRRAEGAAVRPRIIAARADATVERPGATVTPAMRKTCAAGGQDRRRPAFAVLFRNGVP